MAKSNNNITLGNNLKSFGKEKKSLKGAICLDVLEQEDVKKLIYEYEGKKYLNVNVFERKEASQYGSTHFIVIDTFVPEPKGK